MIKGIPKKKKNINIIRSSAEELRAFLSKETGLLNQERVFRNVKYNEKIQKSWNRTSMGDF